MTINFSSKEFSEFIKQNKDSLIEKEKKSIFEKINSQYSLVKNGNLGRVHTSLRINVVGYSSLSIFEVVKELKQLGFKVLHEDENGLNEYIILE